MPSKPRNNMTLMSVRARAEQTRQYLRAASGGTEFHQNRVRGILMNIQSDKIHAQIRAEIEPKVIALRARQEVLESIGTRVNGGF